MFGLKSHVAVVLYLSNTEILENIAHEVVKVFERSGCSTRLECLDVARAKPQMLQFCNESAPTFILFDTYLIVI